MQDFYLILTNQPGATSWPLIAATFMLMRKVNAAHKNKEVLKFLGWGRGFKSRRSDHSNQVLAQLAGTADPIQQSTTTIRSQERREMVPAI